MKKAIILVLVVLLLTIPISSVFAGYVTERQVKYREHQLEYCSAGEWYNLYQVYVTIYLDYYNDDGDLINTELEDKYDYPQEEGTGKSC
ncbi:hypothetical protein [Chengkuizengella marina]|uniref:Uncharacterized protein n=1 Tax=Chengkuizengella marina TaxID=2507566 RepID=A0A6N9Q1W2_9BACL|nr:hypothetical protein [Chengkuizengella marina]NBI28993.1 hypothetical protein [Chengkuizengella marina]